MKILKLGIKSHGKLGLYLFDKTIFIKNNNKKQKLFGLRPSSVYHLFSVLLWNPCIAFLSNVYVFFYYLSFLKQVQFN